MATGRRLDVLTQRIDEVDRQVQHALQGDARTTELIIAASLAAQAALRRVVDPALPLLPEDLSGHVWHLQTLTGETGPAWRARINRMGDEALAGVNPADPAAVAVFRAQYGG